MSKAKTIKENETIEKDFLEIALADKYILQHTPHYSKYFIKQTADQYGDTVLHYLATYGRFLLAKSINNCHVFGQEYIHKKNNSGHTAVDIACFHAEVKLVKWFFSGEFEFKYQHLNSAVNSAFIGFKYYFDTQEHVNKADFKEILWFLFSKGASKSIFEDQVSSFQKGALSEFIEAAAIADKALMYQDYRIFHQDPKIEEFIKTRVKDVIKLRVTGLNSRKELAPVVASAKKTESKEEAETIAQVTLPNIANNQRSRYSTALPSIKEVDEHKARWTTKFADKNPLNKTTNSFKSKQRTSGITLPKSVSMYSTDAKTSSSRVARVDNKHADANDISMG